MSSSFSPVDCNRCCEFHKAPASKDHKPPSYPLNNYPSHRDHLQFSKATVSSNASFACEGLHCRMGYSNGYAIFNEIVTICFTFQLLKQMEIKRQQHQKFQIIFSIHYVFFPYVGFKNFIWNTLKDEAHFPLLRHNVRVQH